MKLGIFSTLALLISISFPTPGEAASTEASTESIEQLPVSLECLDCRANRADLLPTQSLTEAVRQLDQQEVARRPTLPEAGRKQLQPIRNGQPQQAAQRERQRRQAAQQKREEKRQREAQQQWQQQYSAWQKREWQRRYLAWRYWGYGWYGIPSFWYGFPSHATGWPVVLFIPIRGYTTYPWAWQPWYRSQSSGYYGSWNLRRNRIDDLANDYNFSDNVDIISDADQEAP